MSTSRCGWMATGHRALEVGTRVRARALRSGDARGSDRVRIASRGWARERGRARARSTAEDAKVDLRVASAGAILVPHPDKADKGGEDACFVLKQSGAFGVFDGVGGWAEEGVDPAEYSEKFAEKSAQSILRGTQDPVEVLRDAHEETQVVGSCTACIAMLKDGNVLDVANLGDAGALVARQGSVVYKTVPQQHDFNLPYQLGWVKVYPEGDRPEAADRSETRMEPGDALVLGSDGLWDNVPHEEVAKLCAQYSGDAEECAEAIATLAFGYSCDPEYDSPFTQQARKAAENRPEWGDRRSIIGGKMDDIAVVVAFVDKQR